MKFTIIDYLSLTLKMFVGGLNEPLHSFTSSLPVQLIKLIVYERPTIQDPKKISREHRDIYKFFRQAKFEQKVRFLLITQNIVINIILERKKYIIPRI